MQYSQARKKHVVFTMVVLEICLHVTAEFTSAQISQTPTTVNTLENMTTCDNCSSEAEEMKSSEEKCSNSRGWNLRGSDWGCCGNYVGCCTFASYVCYIHDALCRCCDIGGKFCGPMCKPEPGCRTVAAHTFQNDADIHKNVKTAEPEVEEPLNVESFSQGGNHSGNYFVRGRAISGTGELLFQDGDSNGDGSGDAE